MELSMNQLINIFISGVIVVSCVVLFYKMIKNSGDLSVEFRRINELLTDKNIKYKKSRATHELIEESDEELIASPERVSDYEKKFNELRSAHNVYIQIIPIFPLLGILGTVIGIIMNAGANTADDMLASVNTALFTTLFGLLASIALKFYDAVKPSKTIYDAEILFDNYYRKYEIAVEFDEKEKVKR